MPPALVLIEEAADVLSLAATRGNLLLSSALVSALQWHGIWLAGLLATLWVIAGRARQREVQRQRRRALGRHGPKGSLAALAAAEQEVRWRLAGGQLHCVARLQRAHWLLAAQLSNHPRLPRRRMPLRRRASRACRRCRSSSQCAAAAATAWPTGRPYST